MELTPEEDKIVKKYMSIHKEFNDITKSMEELKKRSSVLIDKLNKLRETELETIKKIENNGKEE
tara:strand:- start:582 stop:773 length:192 start_codon:yes stop_codon:yes gene_type:complete